MLIARGARFTQSDGRAWILDSIEKQSPEQVRAPGLVSVVVYDYHPRPDLAHMVNAFDLESKTFEMPLTQLKHVPDASLEDGHKLLERAKEMRAKNLLRNELEMEKRKLREEQKRMLDLEKQLGYCEHREAVVLKRVRELQFALGIPEDDGNEVDDD